MALAREEAEALGHHYLGTEHLLLGVLRAEQGVGAAVLTGLGVGLDGARAQVTEMVGSPDTGTDPLPSTPRTMDVLVLAWQEARRGYENAIGSEHILLALLREGQGIAARVLENASVSESQVRVELSRLRG